MSPLLLLAFSSIYMGGHHDFGPFSPDSVLRLGEGNCSLAPIEWTPGVETRLSAVMTSPLRCEYPDAVGFALADSVSGDTLRLLLNKQQYGDAIYQAERLCLRVVSAADSAAIQLPALPEDYTMEKETKEATFTLCVTPSEGGEAEVSLCCGAFGSLPVWSGTWSLTPGGHGAIGFASASGTRFTVNRASLTYATPEAGNALPSEAQISALLHDATEPYSGLWSVLDHNLDSNLIRPGGDYLLAFLPTQEGGYDILYMDGAIVNANSWHTGMAKGHLRPTRMAGLYHASWLDAEQSELDGQAIMQFTGTDLCLLTLPSLGSTLRLHRVR